MAETFASFILHPDIGPSLTLHCFTAVDEDVRASGHEPNGYFWEGIAELLIRREATDLAGQFEWDSEGSMFCAFASDRAPLDRLAELMTPVIADREALRALMEHAAAIGFEFDD